MTALQVAPLRTDLSFGARVSGVTYDLLANEEVRQQLRTIFEEKGLIVFEDVEPSGKMHVALSNAFGELKDHPVATVERVDQDLMPGVIDMRHDPDSEDKGIVEIDGKPLSQWIPWHFDHCYNNELNRAGVLRAIDIPPEGGLTGFVDGVELYRSFSPELRARVEGCNIIYTLDLDYTRMRFGRPDTFREIKKPSTHGIMLEESKKLPRAIHPAVWERDTGEKVLHVSPWMAVGIQNREDAEGDELLRSVCKEIDSKVNPYFHKWEKTQMLIWDNWRMLHAVSGSDPKYPRRMQRTTIKGDYGLGFFENNAQGNKILEMTV